MSWAQGAHLGHCTYVDTMKVRALILFACTAGLLTSIFWPNEVMSPNETASLEGGSTEGQFIDLPLYAAEEVMTAPSAPEGLAAAAQGERLDPVIEPAASQAGLHKGLDIESLTRQGEILAHAPTSMGAYLDSQELHPGRERFLEACGLLASERLEAAESSFAKVSEEDPISTAERGALRQALSGSAATGVLVSAASGESNPLVRGLGMAKLRTELRGALRARDYPAACQVLSDLLEAELSADWAPHFDALVGWAEKLNEAQRFHRWSEVGEWPSLEYVVKPGDSLVAIRKKIIKQRPEMNLCTGLIQRANQLEDGNRLHPEQKLRIPLDPVRTLVSLDARFLLYYLGDEVACAWPVTIGREGRTIPGEYTVGQKKEKPMWFRPGDPVPYGDPENPLGTRWIAWDGSNSLGFHGTWEPELIGGAASDGCIRLRNEDVEVLFEILPIGSAITVVP